MSYKPFKIDVRDALENSYESDDIKDRLREFIVDSEFKQVFGQRLVDRIIERTRDESIDKDGRSLGRYSNSYRESLVFQIYGKSDPVNLTLTGEMLESLDYTDSKYIIVIDVSDDQKGKAEGHITGRLGKYGKAKPRNFLGLPTGEQVEIFKQSMKQYRSNAFAEILI
jgi:hypothetical protein